MRPSVTYTPYSTSQREKTGNISTFTQFVKGDLLTETRNNAEIGDKSYDDSNMPALFSK